jgi:hypothetical protein
MNIALRAFCWTIMRLDYIPRYGRMYRTVEPIRVGKPIVWTKPEWHYMKRGLWGFRLLNRIGLLGKYLKYHNPDI